MNQDKFLRFLNKNDSNPLVEEILTNFSSTLTCLSSVEDLTKEVSKTLDLTILNTISLKKRSLIDKYTTKSFPIPLPKSKHQKSLSVSTIDSETNSIYGDFNFSPCHSMMFENYSITSKPKTNHLFLQMKGARCGEILTILNKFVNEIDVSKKSKFLEEVQILLDY